MTRHVVIGTAGHIDHGKSALVRALTGTDPDRLKEEKERGMTTDLGFAFLGDRVTIIDVPGHEKFVRHMLAGASTIDLVLLVVAADDGVMLQTVEHFEITRLLGITRGIIVINKKDLVDAERLHQVEADVRQLVAGSFLEGAPLVAVSALTGDGIPELRALIDTAITEVRARPDRGIFRLPIDRSFVVKGFGAIVAGTVLAGEAAVGDRLALLPTGTDVRVRGIQKHNQAVTRAMAGERAAFNLQGAETATLARGEVLATPGYYEPTTLLNARLTLLASAPRPVEHLTRVRLHLGTAEILCRVALLDTKVLAPGARGLVQLRLESPTVADWQDRFVVRSYSPAVTIGGGVILEANPGKESRFAEATLARLAALETGDPAAIVEQTVLGRRLAPLTAEEIGRRCALRPGDVETIADGLARAGRFKTLLVENRRLFLHASVADDAGREIQSALAEFHTATPLAAGIRRNDLRTRLARKPAPPVFAALLADLAGQGAVVLDGDLVRLASHRVAFDSAQEEKARTIRDAVYARGFAPPTRDEIVHEFGAGAEPVLRSLLTSRQLVDVGEGIIFHPDRIAEAREKLVALFARQPELRATDFKTALGTSRRYAIPLLNYFDTHGVTVRRGEVRLLRKEH